jgi:hypothetical protein
MPLSISSLSATFRSPTSPSSHHPIPHILPSRLRTPPSFPHADRLRLRARVRQGHQQVFVLGPHLRGYDELAGSSAGGGSPSSRPSFIEKAKNRHASLKHNTGGGRRTNLCSCFMESPQVCTPLTGTNTKGRETIGTAKRDKCTGPWPRSSRPPSRPPSPAARRSSA